jgi:alkyldihydroxyacetonephosphate synthase
MTTQSAARRSINVELLNRLRDVLGGKRVSRSALEGIGYSRDMASGALLETRRGQIGRRPDFIVWPESTEEVSRILRLCNEVRMPVTAFGAGSGWFGGAAPICGGVVIDMKRMNRLERLSELSNIAVCQPGIVGQHLEAELNRHGYTLGHFPGSMGTSTLGGWLASRSAGMAATAYGRVEDMVVSLQVVLADGVVLHTRTAPRRATGPDFNHLFLGSEGTLGVITRAHMRVHLMPEARFFRGLAFKNFGDGLTAVRQMLRIGVRPSFLRLSDEADAAATLQPLGVNLSGSVLSLVFDGRPSQVDLFGRRAVDICRQLGARDHGEEPARVWCERRYAEAYRQSVIMADSDATMDTIEASTSWRDAPAVVQAVHAATAKNIALATHVPHAFPEGPTLRFVMVGPQGDAYDRARDETLAAALQAGAVINFHRAVGAETRRWFAHHSAIDRRLLAGIKKRLDPQNILNPGKIALDAEKSC